MADEDKSDSKTAQQLVEVICTSSGKTIRFVSEVKAGFALTIINHKLGAGKPLALYIEAAKEGEEPIVFGPDSLLRSCGDGWKLQTVAEAQVIAGHNKGAGVQVEKSSAAPREPPPTAATAGSSSSKRPISEDEIRAVLMQRPPVTTEGLVRRFKARLGTPEKKRAFADILKRISRISKVNGQSHVILRDR